MIKLSYYRRLPNGKYRVYSEKGKNMGTFSSEESAKQRLKQIEFFKHKKSICFNDLIKISKEVNVQLTYSSIMRFLNKENPKMIDKFMQIFNDAFNQAIVGEDIDLEEIEKICLLQAIRQMDL